MTVPRALSFPHWLAIVSYLVVVALTAAVGIAGSGALSAARAFAAMESRWSEAQKEAVHHLQRYAERGDRDDFVRFEAALAAPLAHRAARLALSAGSPNLPAARAGLLQAGSHPDDVEAMMTLFVRYRRVGPVADVIARWDEADRALDELRRLGYQLRQQVESGRPGGGDLRALALQLPQLDTRLVQHERLLSQRVGEAARQAARLVAWSSVLLALMLGAVGLLGTAWLLDQQRRAEQALREARERWMLAADAAGIGVFDWDIGRNRVRLDARAAALSGLPAVDVETDGHLLAATVPHPDDRDGVDLALRHAIERAETAALRFRTQTATGDGRQIELRARVRGHGRRPRMVGILRDVSGDLHAERLRLDRDAADRANRAKGEFLSRVSHELRTPLNAVLGFAQLLQLDPQEPLQPGQAHRVQQMIDSGRHLLALINDMLDVTSLDEGAVKLALQPVPLAPLLDRCRQRLVALAHAQQVRLAPAPAADLRVRGDERRLEQVFTNLLSNAIKYNRPDGEVRLTMAADGDDVVATVADTGPGLTAEQVGQLFQPFNRLGAEYSKVEGSGLGLVIARQLVALMGGTVHAHSRLGEGASFAVRLPRA